MSPAESPSPSESSSSDEAADSGIAKFGQTYKWDDGLTVTISEPKSFKPGEYAAGGEKAKAHALFNITVTNGSDQPFDPSLFIATLTSGEEEGEQVFDSENGLEGSPNTKVLPGKKVKFTLGFGLKDLKDVVLEVTPDFEHDSAIFSNSN